MEVSLLWELGKSQQYNLTNRGKMKKRRKRGNAAGVPHSQRGPKLLTHTILILF